MTEDRLYELLAEVNQLQWDIIVITETWRECERESFVITGGHLFCGSGGFAASRGVAFLVNERWANKLFSFIRVDERVAYLDVRLHSERLRFIATYFPHSGYDDNSVQVMYDILHTVRAEARRKRIRTIICGEFNAVVGGREEYDDPRTIGQHGLDDCNARGRWLKHWATANRFMISNTFFSKRPAARVTHVGSNSSQRQIDYILLDWPLRLRLRDAASSPLLNLGSDHRAVRVRLTCRGSTTKVQRTPTTGEPFSWKRVDIADYQKYAQGELALSMPDSDDISTKIESIESILTSSAKKACRPRETCPDPQGPNLIRDLIMQRRLLGHGHDEERKAVSKSIRKHIKAVRAANSDTRINEILTSASGLDKISQAKTCKRKVLATHMKDHKGREHYERQSIADIFADFYGRLYASRNPSESWVPSKPDAEIPKFSHQEVKSCNQ